MEDAPGAEEFSTWLFALYGVTMLSVQVLENAISFLYYVANDRPGRDANASTKRYLKNLTDRAWRAFQHGTGAMKLNDAKVGVRNELSKDLYEDLDSFLKGPRNQLAHNFLVERAVAVDQGGKRDLIGAAVELLEVNQRAKHLREKVFDRAMEIIQETSSTSSEPPDDVAEWIEDIARMTMLKQFPSDVIQRLHDRQSEREA